MIEKEFNDRIYTKSTAKREKYTIFMLQNIGLFPLLDSPHTCVYKKSLRNFFTESGCFYYLCHTENRINMKKLFFLFAAAVIAAACPAGAFAQFKIGGKKIDAGKLLNAGKDVATAITLSDEDIARLSRESVEWMDAHNPVAADTTTYGARLKRLTEGITDAEGLPLNFKVYFLHYVRFY